MHRVATLRLATQRVCAAQSVRCFSIMDMLGSFGGNKGGGDGKAPSMMEAMSMMGKMRSLEVTAHDASGEVSVVCNGLNMIQSVKVSDKLAAKGGDAVSKAVTEATKQSQTLVMEKLKSMATGKA